MRHSRVPIAASQPHSFLGIDADGRVGVVRTSGNPHGHLVLRGGSRGPNFGEAEVSAAVKKLRDSKVNPRVLVDCSHDNSQKDPSRQPDVLAAVGAQMRAGSEFLLGAMIESNIIAGRQELTGDKRTLTYGQSITDACVDFATTERMLEDLARDASQRLAVANA